LLVVNVAGLSTALNRQNNTSASHRETRIIKGVLKEARLFDIKGWLDENRVGIIMPETGETGALHARARIRDRIGEDCHSQEHTDIEPFFEVHTFDGDRLRRNGSSDKGEKGQARNGEEKNAVYTDVSTPTLSVSIERTIKRILDISGSLLGIMLLGPLMAIIAAIIRLTSPGPILFHQERVGFLGRRFTFLKFRSMVADSDQRVHEKYVTDLINGHHRAVNDGMPESPLYKMTNDPRVTPIGRFLRKTSLDELPQLFNILKGDMSLVGPRPPIPYEVDKYRLWHFSRIFEVKPGLTGLWQVSGRSQTSFDDMVRLDLRYANGWSLWLDLKILLKTLPAVLSAKGAY
jgi:lipopolysaccharide/colanic/teichoic acid biosynthesis glycosyltransferase